MRIAYLCQQYPPMVNGPSFFSKRLAEGFAEKGHDVLVITASATGEKQITKNGNLTTIYLPSIDNPFRAGQRFMILKDRQITEHLIRFEPDVLHLHDLLLCAPLAVSISKSLQIPMTFTAHQLPWYIAEYAPKFLGMQQVTKDLMWGYARWLIDHSAAVITPTNTIREILRENVSCNPTTISYGIDTDIFYPDPPSLNQRQALCRELDLDPQLPIILHAGRIDKEKRVDLILKAAAKVIESQPVQILVIGDGKQIMKIKALSRSLGINKYCSFPGFIHHERGLPAFYRLASVFVMACEIETLGIVALEASASGLPVIAADASCMPEIVLDNKTGFLFPPGDVQGFSERILHILNDPQLASQMAIAGRLHAQTHRTKRVHDAHEKLYLKMIETYSPQYKPVPIFSNMK